MWAVFQFCSSSWSWQINWKHLGDAKYIIIQLCFRKDEIIEQRKEETKQAEWKKQQIEAELDHMQAQEIEVGGKLQIECGQKPAQTKSEYEETGKEQPGI